MAPFSLPYLSMKALLQGSPHPVFPACPFFFFLQQAPEPFAKHLPFFQKQGFFEKDQPSQAFLAAFSLITQPSLVIRLLHKKGLSRQEMSSYSQGASVSSAFFDEKDCTFSPAIEASLWLNKLAEDIGFPASEDPAIRPLQLHPNLFPLLGLLQKAGVRPFPSGSALFAQKNVRQVKRNLPLLSSTPPRELPSKEKGPSRQDVASLLGDATQNKALGQEILDGLLTDQLLEEKDGGLGFPAFLAPFCEAIASGEHLEIAHASVSNDTRPPFEFSQPAALFFGASTRRIFVFPAKESPEEVVLTRLSRSELMLFLQDRTGLSLDRKASLPSARLRV